MGIFVDNNNTFEVKVKYLFDEDGEIHILTDEDEKNISLSLSEKASMPDGLTHATDVPFNNPVDISKFNKEDIKCACFAFRKPSFDDIPIMLSSFAMVSAEGDVSPGDIFKFNNKKLKMLFVSGSAQDECGKKVEIDKSNVGSISHVLGSAMAVRMNEKIKM